MIFHPLQNNVLDFVGKELKTLDGKNVIVSRCGRGVGFIVKVNGKQELKTDCNLTVSGYLNKLDIVMT